MLIPETRAVFDRVFGYLPQAVAIAPGRVNLIGEHTDYNDGFVLPMAIEHAVAVAFAPRTDRIVRAHAAAYDEAREIDRERLVPPGGRSWFDYVAGVAWALDEDGSAGPGADLVILGDVPIGAGLSSSAATEMAVARALCAAAGTPWKPKEMALLGQRAENKYVGVGCGIMDQMASAVAEEGCALLLDCRSLETQAIPLPSDAVVAVMDTGIRRELATSAYNDRRASCEAAAASLRQLIPGLRALRDADEVLLERGRTRMDPVAFRRARHVVAENTRPLAFAEALGRGDLPKAGRLMNDSHHSLRDLYQVSCPELDAIVEVARSQPGCYGARMTGAGFGGCAVALVATDRLDDFLRGVGPGYRAATGREGAFFACRPASGARVVERG